MSVVVKRVPVEICTNCGEQYSGPEAARLHHEAICKTFGFLTPREICSLREDQLRLTQEEFAKLTGIGLATISRWECGRLVQNRAMDTYLRLLQANPENVRLLRSVSAG
jgi:putative zinc finger/helix-turn-helix YgiT family protein